MRITRALTVRQPYAGAIVLGGKTTENRSKPTPYGGLRVYVHAGKAIPEVTSAPYPGFGSDRLADMLADVGDLWSPQWVREADAEQVAALGRQDLSGIAPACLGALIGEVTLRSSHPEGTDCCADPWALRRIPGDTRPLFHWPLTDPAAYSRPVFAAGKLGVWSVDAVSLSLGEACQRAGLLTR